MLLGGRGVQVRGRAGAGCNLWPMPMPGSSVSAGKPGPQEHGLGNIPGGEGSVGPDSRRCRRQAGKQQAPARPALRGCLVSPTPALLCMQTVAATTQAILWSIFVWLSYIGPLSTLMGLGATAAAGGGGGDALAQWGLGGLAARLPAAAAAALQPTSPAFLVAAVYGCFYVALDLVAGASW